jgi:hypothetical protein
VPPIPDAFDDETLRMIARTSIGGSAVRLTFSNAAGRQALGLDAVGVALRADSSGIRAGSVRPVRFGGATVVEIPPGALVVSDPVELAVPPLTDLAVSVYLSEPAATGTTHDLGLHTTYVASGNAVAAPELPNAATNKSYFWLNGIEVRTEGDAVADRRLTGAAGRPYGSAVVFRI